MGIGRMRLLTESDGRYKLVELAIYSRIGKPLLDDFGVHSMDI
jgi:hypothetical protein